MTDQTRRVVRVAVPSWVSPDVVEASVEVEVGQHDDGGRWFHALRVLDASRLGRPHCLETREADDLIRWLNSDHDPSVEAVVMWQLDEDEAKGVSSW